MGEAHGRTSARIKRSGQKVMRGGRMNKDRVDALGLEGVLEEIDSQFQLSFDDQDTETTYYFKDHSGRYHEVDTWLVPYRQAESIHRSIVRPLILQIALESKKIEAYEMPYAHGENEVDG